jgi:hypothetical protein
MQESRFSVPDTFLFLDTFFFLTPFSSCDWEDASSPENDGFYWLWKPITDAKKGKDVPLKVKCRRP